MSCFLSVPMKQTSEVDLIKPLTRFVQTLPGLCEEVRVRTTEAIVELDKLRRAVTSHPANKQQSSLELIIRYYDQLCAIERRLPMTPIQNPISFKWKDAFAGKNSVFFGHSSLTINDAGFERAAILFNCGAMMSAIASSQNVYTDEELKSMTRLYQQAAGVFAALQEKTSQLIRQEPTTDLLPETLSSLTMLMLAQAQEAVYIKAVKGGLNASALAKIASQCSDLYQKTQSLMAEENVKGIWEKDWVMTVSGKGLAYSALAQYQQALTLDSVSDIGEKLARLQEAVRVMGQCANYLPSSSNLLKEATLVRSEADRTSKDNDFIYHAHVPSVKSLSPIGKVAVTKPTPVGAPMSPRFKDMFDFLPDPSSLQPPPALERSNSVLVIEEDSNFEGVTSEGIMRKSAKIKLCGGVDGLKWKLNELSCLHKHNSDVLNEAFRLLVEEKQEDDAMRAQFRNKWTRLASANLTQPLVRDLVKYRDMLKDAKQADASLSKRFADHSRGIELLSKTEAEIRCNVPRMDQDKGAVRILFLAYEVFFEMETNIAEGMKFYTDLSPILVRHQQGAMDYCYARRTEKADLLNQILATPPRHRTLGFYH